MNSSFVFFANNFVTFPVKFFTNENAMMAQSAQSLWKNQVKIFRHRERFEKIFQNDFLIIN